LNIYTCDWYLKHAQVTSNLWSYDKNLELNKSAKKAEDKCEDTKGVIRSRKSKKYRQHNGQVNKRQKDKQRSTQYHTEN